MISDFIVLIYKHNDKGDQQKAKGLTEKGIGLKFERKCPVVGKAVYIE